MDLLNDLKYQSEQVGRLAVLDKNDEDATVFVLYSVDEKEGFARLVELDRPNDGQNLLINLNADFVYLLEPIEVLERVCEWK